MHFSASFKLTFVCCDLNFVKIYALLHVNSFSTEIIVVLSLVHLEGLYTDMLCLEKVLIMGLKESVCELTV